jgi:zinc protease
VRSLSKGIFFLILSAILLIVAPSSLSAQRLAVGKFQLDNGLKVMILEDHSTPIVSVQVWYRVGSRNERTGETGLSHMLEHMSFKGSGKLKSEEFSQIVQRNGGTDNASTSYDFTRYYTDIGSDKLELILEYYADMMSGLTLGEEEFRSERDVVREEKRLRDNSPFGRLAAEFNATAFVAHPYRNPIIGWDPDIDAWTTDKIRDYYRLYYVPNNATLVIAGDVETSSALQMARKHFGHIPRGPSPPPVNSVEPEQVGEKRIKVHKEDATSPAILIGYHIPAFDHPDQYALDVISTILSSGKSSRLYKSLVYEKELALSAGGGGSERIDPAIFSISAVARPGVDIAKVEEALLVELDRLKDEDVPDREFRKAMNQATSGFTFGRQSVSSLAFEIGLYEAMGSYAHVENYLDNLSKVTREDIKRVARKYFTELNRTVAVLVPGKG